MGIQIINPSSIDLTAPPTNIGTTTPVAVNSTIFTALPANNTSAFVASGSSLTGSNAQSLVNLSQTWNTTGTPTAILADITDTASNAGSLLMDLKVGGVSRLAVSKGGSGATNTNISTQSGGIAFNPFTGVCGLNGQVGAVASAFSIAANATLRFTSTSNNWQSAGTADLFIQRDAANTLAQRNGVNSQTNRLYKSFTDASNYTRSAWQFDANGVVLAGESAGTGDANIDITFTPKGTGNVRFGTHSVVAAETITGYIEIKDSSGTLRKLAVIS